MGRNEDPRFDAELWMKSMGGMGGLISTICRERGVEHDEE